MADATVAQLLEETTAYPPRSKRTTQIQKEMLRTRAKTRMSSYSRPTSTTTMTTNYLHSSSSSSTTTMY
ncbi:hypothetical protein NFJ02_27g62680 [Pycnococcus provasolii]